MNKHRTKQRKFSLVEMILLGLAAAVLIGGGITHALLKNEQITVQREIKRIDNKISDLKVSIEILGQEIDRELTPKKLRQCIAESKAKLQKTAPSSVTTITSYSSDESDKVSKTVDIAHIRP